MVNSDHKLINSKTIKFLCSYGGRILPRYPDGKLRYQGGETRILSVDCSVSFSELMVKMGEMCGSQVSLRCQLPTEDLDALVSIKSDEDLTNLVEEYDRVNDATASTSSSSLKIRSFLSVPKTAVKKVVSPPLVADSQARSEFFYGGAPRPACLNRVSRPPPSYAIKAARNVVGHNYYSCRYNHQYGGGGGCVFGSSREILLIANSEWKKRNTR